MVECNDSKCPVHGSIKVRGNVFTGKVVSAKPAKTVIIEREIVHFVQKYERYKKIKSRIAAHNPECMNAKEGDIVTIGETRKLSKTKNFVVMSVEGKNEAKKETETQKAEKIIEKKARIARKASK